eukprot:8838972-Alexandrium_andersonii.AAC.1
MGTAASEQSGGSGTRSPKPTASPPPEHAGRAAASRGISPPGPEASSRHDQRGAPDGQAERQP